MKKGSDLFVKKSVASFELGLFILSVFAFAFMIGNIEFVSAGTPSEVDLQYDINGDGIIGDGSVITSQHAAEAGTSTVETGGAGGLKGSAGAGETSKLPTPPSNAPKVDVTNYASGNTGSWSGTTTYAADLTTQLPAGTYNGGTLQYMGEKGIETAALGDGTTATVTAGAEKGTYDMVVTNSNGVTKTVEGTSSVVAKTPVTSAGQTSTKFGSSHLGLIKGTFADAAVSGLVWAGIAYFAGQMIGSLFGMEEQNTEALSTALAAGAGSYRFFSTYSKILESQSWKWLSNPLVGVGIGAVVFVAMYQKMDTEVVTFECMPWQAPSGGNDCEICNDDSLPCSEYRCKSLGQNCEIVNEGTVDEKCVNINPRDVDMPVIKPNYNELSLGHKYTDVKISPPGPGFKIVNLESSDGCLKAFTPLEFGITVNEPAQCKIDFNHTETFDEMISYVGSSNLYSYNHSEKFSLPGAAEIEGTGLVLENGKDLTFYLRCKDKNGNENSAEYAIRFCIDPSPDVTAPQVKATSVVNGGCVAEEQDTAMVEFYVNEPSTCRWSTQDQDYDNMQNEMSCSSELYQMNAAQLFTCQGELSGIPRDGADFYVRCKDQPGVEENDRNENKESFKFSLRGSTGLKLRRLMPNGTIFGAVSPAPVELYAETIYGCNNGRSVCYYSETGNENDYIMFYDTNTDDGIHTQRLDLVGGEHDYYVKCIDEGGNLALDIASFTLDVDTNAPVVARIYEEDQMLKLVTVRDSECAYSFNNCDFSFDEGVEMPYSNSSVHVAEWNDQETYYIKCRDAFRNEDADCSVVVRPTQDFL